MIDRTTHKCPGNEDETDRTANTGGLLKETEPPTNKGTSMFDCVLNQTTTRMIKGIFLKT